MKIDGACHCGRVHYEAEVDPRGAIICPLHRLSDDLRRTLSSERPGRMTGKPKTYVKVGGSGEPVTTAFCGECGSALYSCKGDAPAFLFLRTGAIRQRADLAPTAQGFCESAMPWAMDITRVHAIPRKG